VYLGFSFSLVTLYSHSKVQRRYLLEFISLVASPKVDIFTHIQNKDIIVAKTVARKLHREDSWVAASLALIERSLVCFLHNVLKTRLDTTLEIDDTILPIAEEQIRLLVH
jgi:hypothetical protein